MKEKARHGRDGRATAAKTRDQSMRAQDESEEKSEESSQE